MDKRIYYMFFAVAPLLFISCATTNLASGNPLEVDKSFTKEADRELFAAVKNHDLGTVREKLLADANPNVHDGFGQSALMWACHSGDKEIAEVLLTDKSELAKKAGKKFKKTKNAMMANANAASNYNYTALLCAVHGGNIETLRLLVKNGADLGKSDDHKETVMHKAVKSNRIAMLDEVIALRAKNPKHKIDIDAKDSFGCTALHHAIARRNSVFAKRLLDAGADPSIPTGDGRGTIALALQSRSYTTLVRLLKSEKMTVDTALSEQGLVGKDRKTCTTLDWILSQDFGEDERNLYMKAIENKKNGNPIPFDEYKKALDEYYEDVSNCTTENHDNLFPKIRNRERLLYDTMEMYEGKSRNLMQIAIDNNNTELLLYFLKHGLDWSEPHPYGIKNPLVYALSKKNTAKNADTVKMLIENLGVYAEKLNIGSCDNDGKTPLMLILENTPLMDTIGERIATQFLNDCKSRGVLRRIDDINESAFTYIMHSKCEFRINIINWFLENLISESPNEKVGKENEFYIHYAYNMKEWWLVLKLLNYEKTTYYNQDKNGKTIADRADEDLKKSGLSEYDRKNIEKISAAYRERLSAFEAALEKK